MPKRKTKHTDRLQTSKARFETLENRNLLSAVPFSEPTSISYPYEFQSPRQIEEIELTDVDGDGDHDLLMAQFNRDQTAEVIWYINNGEGRFGEPARQKLGEAKFGELRTVTTGRRDIFLADINGDGAKDLVARREEGTVWFENTIATTGAFAIEPNLALTADQPYVGWSADLNGDGLDDFLVREETGLAWLQNLGPNGFSNNPLTVIEEHGGTFELIIRDTDSDGDLDLVHISNQMSIIENLTGEANDESLFDQPLMSDWDLDVRCSPWCSEFDTTDVDNDGDQDFLITRKGDPGPDRSKRLVSWSENADGQLLPPTLIKTFSETESDDIPFRRRFQFDVDKDGRKDSIALTPTFFSTTEPGLVWYSDVLEATVEHQPTKILDTFAVGDIDGDGDEDWVGSNKLGTHVVWYDGFGPEVVPNTIDTADLNYPNATTFDIDGDGDLDPVVSTDAGIGWYENIGEGQFADVATLFAAPSKLPSDILFGSINGDDLVDAAYSVFDPETFQTTSVYRLNLGNGFGPTIEVPETSSWFIDIDADGDLDIHTLESDVRIAKINDGTGNFTDTATLPTGISSQFTAQDIDGDGDQDLIDSSSDSTIILYENTGDDTYSNRQIAAPTTNDLYEHQRFLAPDWHLVDVDGDEQLDLVVHYTTFDTFDVDNPIFEVGHQIEILKNTDGEFTKANYLDIGGNTSALANLSDIDGDDDLDLLVLLDNDPTYFENLGNMKFERSRLLGSEPHQLFKHIDMADINGDGAPDLLGIEGEHPQLTIRWNESKRKGNVITPGEIDLLYAAINAGSDDEEHDWNDDGVVNVADVDYVLEEIVGTVRGDADLDGDVDFQDFLSIIPTFGQQNVGWAGGDFDGDGTFAFSELLLVFSNFGFNADDQ